MSTNSTKNAHKLRRGDLLFPELSYRIVGILFSVFNELGYGYRERFYQRAIAQELNNTGLLYKEQLRHPVFFNGKKIGVHIFDFLIENKIVLELKQGDYFSKNDIAQAHSYLKGSNLQLAILARFTRRGLKFKRIVNIV